jgi:hypothetical protein
MYPLLQQSILKNFQFMKEIIALQRESIGLMLEFEDIQFFTQQNPEDQQDRKEKEGDRFSSEANEFNQEDEEEALRNVIPLSSIVDEIEIEKSNDPPIVPFLPFPPYPPAVDSPLLSSSRSENERGSSENNNAAEKKQTGLDTKKLSPRSGGTGVDDNFDILLLNTSTKSSLEFFNHSPRDLITDGIQLLPVPHPHPHSTQQTNSQEISQQKHLHHDDHVHPSLKEISASFFQSTKQSEKQFQLFFIELNKQLILLKNLSYEPNIFLQELPSLLTIQLLMNKFQKIFHSLFYIHNSSKELMNIFHQMIHKKENIPITLSYLSFLIKHVLIVLHKSFTAISLTFETFSQ